MRKPALLLTSRCAWTLYNFRLGLAKEAQEAGFEVVCAGADSGAYGLKIREEGLPFIPLNLSGSDRTLSSNLATLRSFRRLLAEVQPDIIHNFTIKPVIFGTLAVFGHPEVVCVNTITGLGRGFDKKSSLFTRGSIISLYRMCLPKSDHLFFQKSADMDPFKDKSWFKKIPKSVVPGSGVNLSLFESALTRVPGRAEIVEFVMCARLLRSKGVAEYLKAAQILGEANVKANFHLVGGFDGTSDDMPKAEINAAVERGEITAYGKVDNVAEILADCDVVVLPSYYPEGVPRSLLEAGAAGRAIITTDHPGCRDAIIPGKSAFLVKPGDANDLAEKMMKMVEDRRQMAELGRAGRAFVSENFDEKIVFGTTIDTYRECMR